MGIAVAATIVLLHLAGYLGLGVLLLLVGPRRRERLRAKLGWPRRRSGAGPTA